MPSKHTILCCAPGYPTDEFILLVDAKETILNLLQHINSDEFVLLLKVEVEEAFGLLHNTEKMVLLDVDSLTQMRSMDTNVEEEDKPLDSSSMMRLVLLLDTDIKEEQNIFLQY